MTFDDLFTQMHIFIDKYFPEASVAKLMFTNDSKNSFSNLISISFTKKMRFFIDYQEDDVLNVFYDVGLEPRDAADFCLMLSQYFDQDLLINNKDVFYQQHKSDGTSELLLGSDAVKIYSDNVFKASVKQHQEEQQKLSFQCDTAIKKGAFLN